MVDNSKIFHIPSKAERRPENRDGVTTLSCVAQYTIPDGGPAGTGQDAR